MSAATVGLGFCHDSDGRPLLRTDGGYEDALFEQQVLRTVEEHDPSTPYFLFWAPHIVHVK